jgi:hypothetical protein
MANDTTPLMLITNVGLDAASTALPEGPYIHIIEFQIGSAYGYTPDRSQTAIQGNLLYQAAPTTYESIGNNTLNIICEIPPEAGPWEFGEVAIFAADSNNNPYLFAIAVFAAPQTKFSSLGTNVVSSYQLNCLLKLQQSTAIFEINPVDVPPDVYNIYQWSDVYPPSLSANPAIPSYDVIEPNSRGDGSFLITTTSAVRTLVDGAYQEIFPDPFDDTLWTVVNSSASFIQVSQAQFNSYRTYYANNRSLLVQTSAGFWRSVSSVVASGSNYQLNLNVTNDGTYNNYPLPVIPQIGETCRIYSDSFAGKLILYDQIVNPPASTPISAPGTPGSAYGGVGTYMPGGGQIQVYGLLQSPSVGGGRYFTSADDLNSTNWNSGYYICNAGAPDGLPANMPVALSGHIWMMVENPLGSQDGGDVISITQVFYPALGGGGDENGVGGAPIYWREWADELVNSQGGWTDWFALSVIGKQGTTGLMAGNGYQTLPGGLILQWGSTTGEQTYVNVTFPIAFPNACLRVLNSVALYGPGDVANNNYSGVVSFTNATAYIGADQNGANWFALGY